MRLFQRGERITLAEVRRISGIKTGLEGALASLQSMTYLCVCDFEQRVNKQGIPYGWHVSVFTPPEALWGCGYVTGAYQETPEKCLERMLAHVRSHFPGADVASLARLLSR